ncbi:DUF6879 family protein [Streptomyces puniciscabiei]
MNRPAPGEPRIAPRTREERRLRLVRKTPVTALVAAGTYFLTHAFGAGTSPVWPAVMSTVLACTALLALYLVDFGKRLDAVEEQRQSVAAVGEPTELFSEDRSLPRSDDVTRLARTYARMSERDSELARKFAQEEIAHLASMMESLSNGSAEFPGENHDWLIALTACASRTVDATSTLLDRDFWMTEPALRYLRAQQEAVRRGVRVRRVFVLSRPEERSTTLEELCVQQRELGIDARVVVRSQLPWHAQLTPVSEFVVFDGELSYETEPDIDLVPARTRLVIARNHIRERIDRFNALWQETEPVEPEPPPRVLTAGCRLGLTLLDDPPVPHAPARIQLRVEPKPGHPWAEPGADRPSLTAVAIPLTPALIEPVSVALRPCRPDDEGAADIVFTPERAGMHRIRVTVHDTATDTVLQQVEASVPVTGTPGEPRPVLPSASHTEGE